MVYRAALVSESMHISYRLGMQEAWICMEFVCASASAISWTREDGQHCDPPLTPRLLTLVCTIGSSPRALLNTLVCSMSCLVPIKLLPSGATIRFMVM